MIEINPLLIQTLFKSSLPLLFGGSYHILRSLFSNSDFHETSNKNLDYDGVLKTHEIKQGPFEIDFLTLLDQVSFGVYTNFFAFLSAMLLIDVFLSLVKHFWIETKSSSRSYFNAKEWKFLNLISENQIKRIYCYAVIFMLLKIIGLGLSFTQSEIFTHNAAFTSQNLDQESISAMNLMDQENQGIARILEEEFDQASLQNPSFSSSMTSDKLSLSMGDILSSLNLNVNAMVLSKDKKIAFVTIDFYGTLKIIDISDIKSPLILSSVNLRVSTYNYRIKSLLLSSDEKTLYTSNSKDLEIIDVTDPSSPKIISQTQSQLLNDVWYSPYFKTSLVVSEKTKTMYIGGIGLEVYDISDPKEPILLKAEKNDETQRAGLTRNEICLSRDGKFLFVANGTLDVYNITNPKDLKLLYSFKTESSPRSIFLSEDSKTVFLLGTSVTHEIIYEEADISSLDSFGVKKTVKLGHKSNFYSPRFLAISPSKSKIFIFAYSDFSGNHNLLVFDRIKETTIEVEKNLIEETFTMEFSADGKTLITGSDQQFMTIELFLDYPNSQIFSASQENVINNISFPFCSKLEMSGDGQYLFALCKRNSSHILAIWDVKNLSAPRSLYDTKALIDQIHFHKNSQTVYLIADDFIMVLDITNRDKIELKKKYGLKDQKKQLLGHRNFIVSSDEKTGFLLRSLRQGKAYVSFMNLSDDAKVFLTLDLKFDVLNAKMILKDDDKTLIFVDKQLVIYDVSDILFPKQIASLPFGVNEPDPYLKSYQLSPDEKTLFIETVDQNEFVKLKIYNVSISASPQLISEKYFHKMSGGLPLSLSPDLNTGYLYQPNSLIKLDLTDLKQPRVTGVIPLVKSKQGVITSYVISPDCKTIYTSDSYKIYVSNMEIDYTIFLKQEKFLLGQKYSDSVAMLRLNASDYSLMDSEAYRVIKLSLLDMKIAPNKENLEMKTSPLPSWMVFDRESNTLTVEPKKQHDIGTYTLCSGFSLKISNKTFDNLSAAENPVSSQDLWAWLISLDYVSPQLYLTDNFGEFDTFFLPSNFTLYKEEIFSILKKYHVETCTSFEVVSSLELKNMNKKSLVVSSLSISPIKVEIKLEPQHGVDVKFVNKPYGSLIPVMKENKTKVSLEGGLKEINIAVNSLVVNFENGTTSDANIVLVDNLNPSVSMEIKNISRYFRTNKPPALNSNVDKTVQEQISAADIQTGKYFTFTLSDDIFEDEYAEKSLEYEFAMANNNTAFPTWLSFNGLILKGTPPEEISGRDIDLVLIAKNEFKRNQIPFKLHIAISAVFCLKLVMRYSPYILTLIGLFVSANKIFNILRKGFYKHSKEFYVGVGEEISTNMIFPISFVKEERKQSHLILKHLNLTEIRDYIDPNEEKLGKEKIISTIKETIVKMPVDIKKQITLYPNPIIDQIMINKFVWMQLDLESERKTKLLFEGLKADCLKVIERDSSSPSGFVINQNKLNQLIQRVGTSHEKRSQNLEESLISQQLEVPGGNIDLLKDAILAFAFENHTLDISPVDVDIGFKQKVPSNFLFRFLKLDLKDIYLDSKNKLNYGINYQITDDKLCFSGVSQNYFKGKTIVAQIKNTRHRILKEIWVHGVSSDFQKDEVFMVKDESEARGQGYEIY